jgi:protein-S-isoprenylcysteine O-methyltransferase Ste14
MPQAKRAAQRSSLKTVTPISLEDPFNSGLQWAGMDYMDLEEKRAQAYRADMQAVRTQHTGYFEKLALLDGGMVALAITAVLGPLHAQLRHRYTLAAALTVLVLGMSSLIARNYCAIKIEYAITGRLHRRSQEGIQTRLTYAHVQSFEAAGAAFTIIGIVLLLAEVWMILW